MTTEVTTLPVLHGATLTLELDADRGLFHLTTPDTGLRIASDLQCMARLGGRTYRSAGFQTVWRPLPEDEGDGLEIRFGGEQDVHLVLLARVDRLGGGIALTLSVWNEGAARTLEEVEVLTTGASGRLDFCPRIGDLRFFQNGWLSGDPAATIRPGPDPAGVESSLIAGVAHADRGDGLVIGFTDAARQFSRIRLRPRGEETEVTALVEPGGVELGAGKAFLSETLWISYGPHPSLLFLDYNKLRRVDARPRSMPVAWDGWFLNYEDSSEKEFLQALDSLEQALPQVDTVIVGDGYQPIHQDGPGIGDWLNTNPRFPHGLQWLARQIRRRGLRPGIWTAPFLIGEQSQLYRYYPNALVRTRGSHQPDWWEMWRGDRVYYLDTTHADGRHYLRDLFENLSYNYGFDFFEVDFTYAGAVDGFRNDLSATPAEALDRGLQAIRETIGDDRYLLLSDAPIGAGSAWADAVRATPDAGPGWKGHCGALSVYRNMVSRAFLGTGLPTLASSPLLLGTRGGPSDEEFRLLATAAGLCGGPISLGGPIQALPADGAAVLGGILASHTRGAVALDLFDRSIPQILALPVHRGAAPWFVVGVFNTSDVPAARRVRLSDLGLNGRDHHVYEFWNHQYLGTRSDEVILDAVPPHTCRVLAVHPDLGIPQVIASDENVLMGAGTIRDAAWHPDADPRSGRLAVELARPGSHSFSIHCTAPTGFVPRVVTARNGRARIDRDQGSGRLVSVQVAFRDQCTCELQF